MTALDTRVVKLERLQGDRGVPSEQEFQDANALLQQRARAALIISLAKVSGRTPDPEVVSFAEATETDPRFAAAEDIVQRYRQAKGYPAVTTEHIAECMARLREAAALCRRAAGRMAAVWVRLARTMEPNRRRILPLHFPI